MPTDRACDCGAPRCERDGCQDKPTPRAQDIEAIRGALFFDASLQDMDAAELACDRLAARLEAAERERDEAKRELAIVERATAERDEMTCDRCGRHHGVVWFAPSDIWNAVMREGDRGKPDEFGFCCPICFMALAEARGVTTTGWLVTPFDDGPVRYAAQVVLAAATLAEPDVERNKGRPASNPASPSGSTSAAPGQTATICVACKVGHHGCCARKGCACSHGHAAPGETERTP